MDRIEGGKENEEENQLTKLAKLKHISLHADPIVGMLLQESKPHLHRIRVPIADLDQPPDCDTLKVLLALLEDEGTPRYRPALRHPRQRHWAIGRQAEVVGCS